MWRNISRQANVSVKAKSKTRVVRRSHQVRRDHEVQRSKRLAEYKRSLSCSSYRPINMNSLRPTVVIQSNKLKAYGSKIRTHTFSYDDLDDLGGPLLIKTLHKFVSNCYFGSVTSEEYFVKLLKDPDSYLEVLENVSSQEIFGFLLHQNKLLKQDDSHQQNVALYQLRCWALSQRHVGSGVIPYLMARASAGLTLRYPGYECYGICPAITPWVSVMFNKRFSDYWPN